MKPCETPPLSLIRPERIPQIEEKIWTLYYDGKISAAERDWRIANIRASQND